VEHLDVVAYINVIVMVVATGLTAWLYAPSVRPAALEKKIGDAAYRRCTVYRWVVSFFMFVLCANYVVYVFHPLPGLPLPRTFPWPWWTSVVIAAVIGVPSGWLMIRGVRDAGKETLVVRKEHGLYGGIYQRMRHPQAMGELPLCWTGAFLCHSPFLALYSFVWVPIFVSWCLAEERDLILRYGQAYEEYRRRAGFLFPRGR
jgi:protein-S-isoprenylcysteine O-methyltransferase Ste14